MPSPVGTRLRRRFQLRKPQAASHANALHTVFTLQLHACAIVANAGRYGRTCPDVEQEAQDLAIAQADALTVRLAVVPPLPA